MSKWYSVCEVCGLGMPEKKSEIDTKDCDHPFWGFFKEEIEDE